jgi:Prp8 binding protein
MSKRPSPPPVSENDVSAAVIKRQRTEPTGPAQELVVAQDDKGKGLIQMVQRTSGLMAPIMRLEGPLGEILDVKFDATGEHLATASKDRSICKFFRRLSFGSHLRREQIFGTHTASAKT